MNAPSIIDTAWHPLATGCPPDWASGWGQDRYGVFVEFTLQEITQRLRWIPPGRFWMGSPEKEPGRYDNEGPRHRVTFSQGFWLFDTPCTQALWEAVMGNNLSRFQSPTRPVEQVSWDDAQTFLSNINEQIPGLNLVLPSEAQWEYACRAGTETAIYTGELTISGKNNAPALDPIAWYGGNSGVDFDLADGEDSSGWVGKQYPHTRAGTHPVKLKRANPWGLYDMLGNVLEWTQDRWHENYQGAPTDGLAWEGQNINGRHTLRGGAWDGKARFVRASSRVDRSLSYRSDLISFRCARVQS
ncbi:formylglycine-generating enzyme family protein [Candidatus Competibacter phosphatis]|uniref:formylglycine-generating enzyme family protein n=1 Tax=Candidatus Competibacter phosphatis TaxID=221280 RepID=UPI0028B049A5|nr:formylglycine-generating enzyme family protein [Candidatus Competibacter phosphatis]